MTAPLISLALPIKNGLPSLKRTIEALQRQSYQNFELIIQDGGSTDGSLDYLRELRMSNIDIVSEPDTGHGQAFNRAWARCRGPLAGMLACDEFLEDNALETFVSWYTESPYAAYCYGGSRLWKNENEIYSIFKPREYDLLKLLMSECSPGQAGIYNKEVIGRDFYYDENLKTCPDFDLFIRLGLRFGPREIIRKDGILHNSIRDRSATTYRPESYDQIAQDKSYIIDRFFVGQGNSPLNHYLRKKCISSMYCWLATHVIELMGRETRQFYKYVIEAARHDPGSEKVAQMVAQTRGLVMHPDTGQVLTRRLVQPEFPPLSSVKLEGAVDLFAAHSEEAWGGAKTVPHGSAMRVTTGPAQWSYAARIPLHIVEDFAHGGWYWVVLVVEVQAGQIGVGILTPEGELKGERLIAKETHKVRLILPVLRTDAAVLIRNASLAERSVTDLLEVQVDGVPVSDQNKTSH